MERKIYSLPSMEEARQRRKNETKIVYDDVKFSDYLKNKAFGKKYFIRTYGCQANVRDSEEMAGILEKIGYQKAEDTSDANVIILNTCAVRENAENKVFGEIGALKSLKLKGQDVKIILCGCMPQKPDVVDKVANTYRHVDIIFGTHEIHNLPSLLEESYQEGIQIVDVTSFEGNVIEGLPSKRYDKVKAFVNIMYGCDKFCTYCIVPYTRGKERSRNEKDIIDECKKLIFEGYKEITLLGQNVNAYGKDLKDGSSFSKLLDDVANLNIPRLRFMTSHPWDFSLDMIDVIAKHNNIMKYIHLPFQSGNDEILRLMGRRYTSSSYLELIRQIKEKMPNISLSTDIIVGFPNETYEQFLDTVKLVEEVKYDGVFTFIYSPREGTPASKMEDNVSLKEKHKRFKELISSCELIIEDKAKNMVGKTYDVLVDSVSKKRSDILSGYTEENKLVNFKGDESLIGQIVKVKIVESHTYSLIGELDE